MVSRKLHELDAPRVEQSPFPNSRGGQLVQLAAHHSFPAVYSGREFPEVGGLISYGVAIPRLRLTKSVIDDLPVLSKDKVYWDAGLPGFGVKVTPKGRKIFLVMYRVAGAGSRLRKYTIGPYGRVTPAMARAQAQKIFAARLDGRDPAEEKKQSRRRLVVDRIDDLVETFIQERVSQIRTARRITNLLRRDVIAHWGTKSIHEIKKRDVIDL